jgi:amino acid adenylation domain-containing protein
MKMNKELEERLSALSPEQIKSLVARLGKNSAPANARARRVEREPGEQHPLSHAQKRLWFLSQLAPESRAFNNPGALRARTTVPLDRELFERSINEVGRRHEILRTTFHSVDGNPVQVVHEEMRLTVGWEDISHLPPAEREVEAERIAISEGRQVFDLATGPLFAMKVLRLDDLDYVLLITSHHIISDGWSMGMLSTESAFIYAALANKRAHDLPRPEFQYVDYVYWEQDWMKNEKFRERLDYWKEKLRAEPEPLWLPTDRPRPPVMSDAGSIEKLTLAPEVAESLRSLASREGVSLFQLLIAAFTTLLYRYTGQEEIVVGTSMANRNRREFQNVMGLFINTLPVRTRITGDETFRDYLREMQATCLDALQHQEVPFEKLVEELNPTRSLNAHPLFQVMFVQQNVPALYVVPGMKLELLKVDYQTAKFDLNLWVEELNDELLLTLHYSRDLFDAATVKRILAHYQTILQSIVREPDCAIKYLNYFSDQERDFVLNSRVAAKDIPAADTSFDRRFESQVEATPDAAAVECPDERLTYRELNSRANRVARHLQSLGVADDNIVALLLERDARAVTAMLGIMKAGGAYLPLDPSHPSARVEWLLSDSGAGVLVTEERFRPLVEPLSADLLGRRIVYLDTDWETIARNSDENLERESQGEQLAYVIYTSGTTGMPKGVCVEQRNLVNYCDAVWREMKLAAGDRLATVTSLAADLGNTMIFPPLAHGGCVVVVPQVLTTDARLLADHFERNPVDCLKIVPSHLRALLDTDRARHIFPEKLLVLGGEASSNDLVERVRATGARCRILNHYGPTECTVGALTYEVADSRARETRSGAPPVGFPLAGCKAYVLDAEMQPVPVGVGGELYLGGACVARGYLNSPDQTAARFMPDPFNANAGTRFYRTGDRARMLEDGAIEFLGRVDRQIKIRGFRVELSEIENVLRRHADVDDAVLLPPEETDPKQQLIAFVQPTPDAPNDAAALKDHLRQFLPSYMIPASLVFLETIPLTANGKIDYRALPRFTAVNIETFYTPPRDQIELELAHIWQELLGVERVGVTDNFFELGGHSLIAVQLLTRINEKFDRKLPLASLFEHGTIEGLAGLIRGEGSPAQSTPLVLIREGSGQQLFFVHPAGGNVLCYYELARALGDGFAFYGLQAASHDDGVASRDISIGALARQYLDAIPEAREGEPPVFGGWSMGALVAFEMARLYASERDQLPTVAVLDQAAPRPDGERDAKGDELTRLLTFSKKVSQLIGRDLGVTRDALAEASASQRASVFLDKFKTARLVPEATSVQDFQGFLELMLAHNDAATNYAPGIYDGRVIVFRAEESLAFEPALREAFGSEGEREPDLGWQKYVSQPIEVINVPGDHVTMITSPNVQTLAAQLARRVVQKEQLA